MKMIRNNLTIMLMLLASISGSIFAADDKERLTNAFAHAHNLVNSPFGQMTFRAGSPTLGSLL